MERFYDSLLTLLHRRLPHSRCCQLYLSGMIVFDKVIFYHSDTSLIRQLLSVINPSNLVQKVASTKPLAGRSAPKVSCQY